MWNDKHSKGMLYKNLRHSGKRYNKRSSRKAGRGCIPNRVDIKERPCIVEEKSRIGDWELDTIVGSEGSGGLASIVDRCAKLTKLVLMPDKTAKSMETAVTGALGPISEFVNTMTSDNGKEFANHKAIANALGAKFYFATPYHSWERGLNEHTNGLVRQYFPKGTNFSKVSPEEVQRVETLLNTRPRKILNFETPLEFFTRMQAEIQV